MDVLDVLRGVAIGAILLVNIGSLSGHDFLDPAKAATLPWAQHDATAAFLLHFLVTGKFYCLFSFLFGIGFSVFIERARRKEGDPVRRFKRRLTGLLIVGLVHTTLIWYGDILALYAVLGLLLILFLDKDDRTVLRWAFGLLALPVAIYAGLLIAAAVALRFVQATSGGGPAGDAYPDVLLRAAEGFASGNYIDIVIGNVVFTAANFARRLGLMFLPRVFGMFLLGLYAGRAGLFARLDAHAALLRRVFWCGLAAGLPLAYLAAHLDAATTDGGPVRSLTTLVVESIATPALTLAYTAGVSLLYLRSGTWLNVLAPAGRMALTNYLAQSVAGVGIFYGIGLGWYGRASLTMLLAGCAAFFAAQMIASRVWLAYAAYGPAEWAWRMFTYGRHLPLMR
jgi:uncharacterized protein